MEINELHIVFIHEVGHYIAHSLNFELYGLGEIDSIKLIEHLRENKTLYKGKTIPKIPENISKNIKCIHLTEKIAELIYGCYFQSLFTKRPLTECFDCLNPSAKGFHDALDLNGGLAQFGISIEKKKLLFPFIQKEYFEKLKMDDYVNQIFNISLKDCLIKTN